MGCGDGVEACNDAFGGGYSSGSAARMLPGVGATGRDGERQARRGDAQFLTTDERSAVSLAPRTSRFTSSEAIDATTDSSAACMLVLEDDAHAGSENVTLPRMPGPSVGCRSNEADERKSCC